jgi:hypothetical protein
MNYDIEIHGELPKTNVLFSACDNNYFFDHACSFILSADKNNFNTHIHIVNPSADTIILTSKLKSLVKNNLTFSFNDVDITNWDPAWLYPYYASLRFLVLPEIIKHAKKVIILDIDSLVLKEFKFPTKPVGYFLREENPRLPTSWEREGSRVNAGIVYFDINSMYHIRNLIRILNSLDLRWYRDQIALHRALNRIPIRLCHVFGNDFLDSDFLEDSFIWTGKGNRKYHSTAYLSKKNYYLNLEKNIDL